MSKQPLQKFIFLVFFLAITMATHGCGSSSSSSSTNADAETDSGDTASPSDILTNEGLSPHAEINEITAQDSQDTDTPNPSECTPKAEKYCAGDKVILCNGQGTEDTIEDCGDQGLVCVKGKCEPYIPSCVQPQLIEYRSGVPEAENLVAVVSVDDCENQPVPNLSSDDFSLNIDGKPSEADLVVLERTPEYFITLVLDSLSLSQESKVRSKVVEGAFTFVNELMSADFEVDVAISVAFTGSDLEIAVEHSTDPSAIKSAITQYFTLAETKDETPIASELVEILEQNQQARDKRRDLTAGGALALGYVIFFSDGSHQDEEAKLDQLFAAVDVDSSQLLTLGVSSEGTGAQLEGLPNYGAFTVSSSDDLPESFTLAADRIKALAARTYPIGICPQAPEGKHQLSISILDGAGTTENLDFEGTDSSQCASGLFENACDLFSCGGAYCGACAEGAPCMEAYRCPCEGLSCGIEHGVSCGSCGEKETCASDQKSCTEVCKETKCGIEQTGYLKISAQENLPSSALDDFDGFGGSIAEIPDINSDGIPEMAVGASADDDGAKNAGAVWLMMMNPGGTIQSQSKISSATEPFTGNLDEGDLFGSAVHSPGDIDGDGAADIIVGARQDDDGGENRGAIWVLFLQSNGTVKSTQKISSTAGGFDGNLDNHDEFGSAVVSLGDLNGDGTPDIFVSAINDDDGGTNKGAVWLIFLNADGTAKGHQKISATSGNFDGDLENQDMLGSALADLGDINGDGTRDLGVGMPHDDHGEQLDCGSVWILFLDDDATVKSQQQITLGKSGFTGDLDSFDNFGAALISPNDLDDNGVNDLVVGSIHDDDGGPDRGALWILFLKSDGTVQTHQKVSATKSKFKGTIDDGDKFGISLAPVNDSMEPGILSLVVGATGDDDGGKNRGAVWKLSMTLCGICGTNAYCSNDQSSCIDACGEKVCGFGDKNILCGQCIEPQVCSDEQTQCQCVDPLFVGANCDECKDPIFSGDNCSSCTNPNANISTGCLTCLSPSSTLEECCGYCGTKKECIDGLCTPIKEDDSCFFANDGICDTAQNCPPGTDCTDCGGTDCQCTPQCQQKECGPDGCGGECGPGCDAGYACIASTETAAATCILESSECGAVAGASCDGYCTGADPPANCMCDESCQDFGDCCPDYVSCCLSE